MTHITRVANQFLADQGIRDMPVDIQKVAEKLGYIILPSDLAVHTLSALGVSDVDLTRQCFSIISDDKKYIFYDPDLVPAARQNYIAHELGHHYLGHRDICGYTPTQQMEDEADEFMRRVRAPMAALIRLDISSPEQLEEITGLDQSSATIAYREYLQYVDQQQGIEIDREIGSRYNHLIVWGWVKAHKTILSVVASVLVVSAGMWGVYHAIYKQPTTPSTTIQRQIIHTQQSGNTTSTTTDDITPVDGAVYWTAAGSVYHLYEDCQHIKNSLEVFSGSVEDAQNKGKKSACKTCLTRSAK